MTLLNNILCPAYDVAVNLQKYISDCCKTASVSDDISSDILRMTASLYALWDNITVAAPLKEKVQIWETCYAISRQQKNGFTPHHLKISACAQSGSDYITLSEEEICDELLDYSGEIEAWLDEYFSEDYPLQSHLFYRCKEN